MKKKEPRRSSLSRPPEGVVEEAAVAAEALPEVNVRTAKDQLSSLLERAAQGEEIVITSDGKPKAMIVRYRPALAGRRAKSMADLRKIMTKGPDSTPMLRRLRDEGY